MTKPARAPDLGVLLTKYVGCIMSANRIVQDVKCSDTGQFCEVITTIARECLFWPIFAPQFLLDLSVFPSFSVIGLSRLFHLLITTLIVYFWLTYIDIHLHFTFTLPIFIWSIGEIIPFFLYILFS